MPGPTSGDPITPKARAFPARPFGIAFGSPSDSVPLLDRDPDPLCATLLAETLPKAIKVPLPRSERLTVIDFTPEPFTVSRIGRTNPPHRKGSR